MYDVENYEFEIYEILDTDFTQLVKERSFYVYLYPWSSCYYNLASQLPIIENC